MWKLKWSWCCKWSLFFLLLLLQKHFIQGQQNGRELAKRTVNFKRNLMYENIHAQKAIKQLYTAYTIMLQLGIQICGRECSLSSSERSEARTVLEKSAISLRKTPLRTWPGLCFGAVIESTPGQRSACLYTGWVEKNKQLLFWRLSKYSFITFQTYRKHGENAVITIEQ